MASSVLAVHIVRFRHRLQKLHANYSPVINWKFSL
jgi:hypothetical protein